MYNLASKTVYFFGRHAVGTEKYGKHAGICSAGNSTGQSKQSLLSLILRNCESHFIPPNRQFLYLTVRDFCVILFPWQNKIESVA